MAAYTIQLEIAYKIAQKQNLIQTLILIQNLILAKSYSNKIQVKFHTYLQITQIRYLDRFSFSETVLMGYNNRKFKIWLDTEIKPFFKTFIQNNSKLFSFIICSKELPKPKPY